MEAFGLKGIDVCSTRCYAILVSDVPNTWLRQPHGVLRFGSDCAMVLGRRHTENPMMSRREGHSLPRSSNGKLDLPIECFRAHGKFSKISGAGQGGPLDITEATEQLMR